MDAMDFYSEFAAWLDEVLKEQLPEGIAAFNFNLYEGDDSFDIQLIGASRFDEEDDDWACDEVFTSEEDVYYLPRENMDIEWQEGLNCAIELAETYLDEGKYAGKLKDAQAVAIGFVDGDLTVLYTK